MKVAVIGKGTAGSVAAAYLKKNIKHIEIDLYYSRDIATIGVGEGGGPRLSNFIVDLGIDDYEFSLKTEATRKWGILFENWGSKRNQTVHHFHPAREKYSYHFDASRLHDVLIRDQQINIIEGHVEKITKAGIDSDKPSVTCKEETSYYDYVIDASGFTKQTTEGMAYGISEEKKGKSLLLANCAYLVQTKSSGLEPFKYNVSDHTYDSLTLSKALKSGWMFVIPLKHRVSYGYIHNNRLSEFGTIKEELHREIGEIDPGHAVISTRTLNFKSFTSSEFVDKSVFSIGNRAAFAEPLEATAIEFILRECEEICDCITQKSVYIDSNRESVESLFNRRISLEMQRIALFIGWHYSNGSIYNSEFWKKSSEHYLYMREELIEQEIVDEFDAWLSTLSYTRSCPNNPFFGWSFRSFEEVASAIT